MTFHIGQKVVYVGGPDLDDFNKRCTEAGWGEEFRIDVWPDRIFTIRGIDPRHIPYHGCVGLLFEEYSFPEVLWGGETWEPASPAKYFRPLIERKLPESLTALLDIKNHKSLENV